jgi:hypothetical protein
MILLASTFLMLAAGAFWLTSVHPARNVLRLRWTVVSFFLVLSAISMVVPIALRSPSPELGTSSLGALSAR